MTTAFDAIAALFDGNDPSFGTARGRPKGTQGARSWSFSLDAVDRDLMEDAADLAEYLGEDTGVEAGVLHTSVVEGDGDDQCDEYTHIVGHLDADRAKCWAVQIKATVPHVEAFDVGAEVLLLEDPRQIRLISGKKDDEELEAVARALVGMVNGYAGGNNEKLLALFDAVADHPDGGFMRVLEAKHRGAGLDASTPAGKGKTPRRRV